MLKHQIFLKLMTVKKGLFLISNYLTNNLNTRITSRIGLDPHIKSN
jgi:hypothetical protein